ncbi:MAG TPA: hypothetical protein VGA70_06430 [Longimicrobiales bacterium]
MAEPPPHLSELSVRDRRHRERRLWRMAFLVSALLHMLIFVGWRHTPVPISPFAAAGPRAGDDRAAAGSMQAMNVRTPARMPIVPPPIPIPTLDEIEPVVFDEDLSLEPAAVDGDAMGELGPGIADGTGRGDGGTAEEGLFRLVPARPRGMIIPPDHDKLRNAVIEVWVFVDERGQVVPDSTVLRPPTSDRGLNRRLIQEAAEWIFIPATKQGKPVASWTQYTISGDRPH